MPSDSKFFWSCLLVGDPLEIESLKRLVTSDALGNERYAVYSSGNDSYITRLGWDEANNTEEAFDLMSSDLAIVFGAFDLMERKTGVSMGQVVRISEDGQVELHVRQEFSLPRKTKGPADPVLFARLIKSTSHPHLNHAIQDFSGNGSWYEVYNCLESLMKHYGKKGQLFKRFPDKANSLRKLKQTANFHRHSKSGEDPIENATGLNQAKAMIEELFEAVANDVARDSDR